MIVLFTVAWVIVGSMWILRLLRKTPCNRSKHYTVPSGPLQGPNSYIKVRLSEVFPIADDSKVFRFELPSQQPLGLAIGKYLNVRKRDGDQELIRQYTPTSRVTDRGFFDLVIRLHSKQEAGMNSYVNSLSLGDTIEIAGPCGDLEYLGCGEFTVKTQEELIRKQVKYLGFIAKRVGIIPCFQIIQFSGTRKEEILEMSLIYVDKTESGILLRPIIEEFIAEQKLSAFYVLEKPPDSWRMGVGEITKQHIQDRMPPPSGETLIVTCGPQSFLSKVSSLLAELGYTQEMIYKF